MTKYNHFSSIDIDTIIGVSSVYKDSQLIAKHAGKLKFKSALDMGTGTGFIAIYLSKLGFKCQGVDINPKAIDIAKKNAAKNNVKVSFYISDLFDNVRGKFDLIIFNPPFGNMKSSFFSRYLEIIKSLFPRNNPIVSGITFQLIKKQRKKLIGSFLSGLGRFLTRNGKAIILLREQELGLVKDIPFRIIDRYWKYRIVLIGPLYPKNSRHALHN